MDIRIVQIGEGGPLHHVDGHRNAAGAGNARTVVDLFIGFRVVVGANVIGRDGHGAGTGEGPDPGRVQGLDIQAGGGEDIRVVGPCDGGVVEQVDRHVSGNGHFRDVLTDEALLFGLDRRGLFFLLFGLSRQLGLGDGITEQRPHGRTVVIVDGPAVLGLLHGRGDGHRNDAAGVECPDVDVARGPEEHLAMDVPHRIADFGPSVPRDVVEGEVTTEARIARVDIGQGAVDHMGGIRRQDVDIIGCIHKIAAADARGGGVIGPDHRGRGVAGDLAGILGFDGGPPRDAVAELGPLARVGRAFRGRLGRLALQQHGGAGLAHRNHPLPVGGRHVDLALVGGDLYVADRRQHGGHFRRIHQGHGVAVHGGDLVVAVVVARPGDGDRLAGGKALLLPGAGGADDGVGTVGIVHESKIRVAHFHAQGGNVADSLHHRVATSGQVAHRLGSGQQLELVRTVDGRDGEQAVIGTPAARGMGQVGNPDGITGSESIGGPTAAVAAGQGDVVRVAVVKGDRRNADAQPIRGVRGIPAHQGLGHVADGIHGHREADADVAAMGHGAGVGDEADIGMGIDDDIFTTGDDGTVRDPGTGDVVDVVPGAGTGDADQTLGRATGCGQPHQQVVAVGRHRDGFPRTHPRAVLDGGLGDVFESGMTEIHAETRSAALVGEQQLALDALEQILFGRAPQPRVGDLSDQLVAEHEGRTDDRVALDVLHEGRLGLLGARLRGQGRMGDGLAAQQNLGDTGAGQAHQVDGRQGGLGGDLHILVRPQSDDLIDPGVLADP